MCYEQSRGRLIRDNTLVRRRSDCAAHSRMASQGRVRTFAPASADSRRRVRSFTSTRSATVASDSPEAARTAGQRNPRLAAMAQPVATPAQSRQPVPVSGPPLIALLEQLRVADALSVAHVAPWGSHSRPRDRAPEGAVSRSVNRQPGVLPVENRSGRRLPLDRRKRLTCSYSLRADRRVWATRVIFGCPARRSRVATGADASSVLVRWWCTGTRGGSR